ncbi:response regulator transcription factor [Streptococcus dentapri]|uniref:Response regulator transcription factor n=1 Tax=Streptococcus dentapri TaxID=573564 RepID=A0ABV8D0N0_9STRE
MAKRILMIESEKSLARLVSLELQNQGYRVATSQDGRSGLKNAQEKDFELIVIDFKLSDQDGFELMHQIRQAASVPIIMMVDRNDKAEVLPKTDELADDYLIKPFAIGELLEKVDQAFERKNIKRRKPFKLQTTYRDLVLDEKNKAVIRNGEIISLTNREFALLSTLLYHIDKVMTREELLSHVWSYNEENIETNIVDVYIRYLRDKIDQSGKDSYIETVRGLGYVIRSND